MENEKQEGAILSPLNEELPYDYDKLRDTTTVEAIKDIWKMFGENNEKLIYTTKTAFPEIQSNHEEISQKIVEILEERKVATKDMQWMVEQFQTVIYSVFDILSRRKKELEKEFLARSIGTRDPGNNKYSAEMVTLGDLFTSLKKIREKQGDNGHDYFFIEKK